MSPLNAGFRRTCAGIRRRLQRLPLVSVITATYNWSSVLRYAIQSVLWQTYPHFELLVIGDGCTDDSEAVTKSFRDWRVRWHNLPENSGSQPAPNNKGLELARGDYVAYLGHDDVWHPTHLGLLVRAMHASAGDVAYTNAVMIGPEGSNIRVVTGESLSGRYERGMLVVPSSMMHRRSMVKDIGGWRDFRTIPVAPEMDLLTRAFDGGKRFTPVSALTVFKFNSAYRPNSYVEKPCHEQAEYVRRIQHEPDFVAREWNEINRVKELGLVAHYPAVPEVPHPKPLGWEVHQSRRIRGLPPLATSLVPSP
ncbi:MAG TPA: glycosyltransferase [Gemmataceae bacterium]|nr:glycosyltransferase [Gemmataceae bacterium]